VRKYNGVAPYPVRRPYHVRDEELERAYRDSGEDILSGITARIKDAGMSTGWVPTSYADDEGKGGGGHGGGSGSASVESQNRDRVRLWDVVRGWLAKLVT